MATGKTTADKFANRALATVTQTAINTLTFEPVRFAVGLFQGVGLILHKVHYYPDNNTVRELVAATDYIEFGITTTNRVTSLDPLDQAIIGLKRITGVGATVAPWTNPIEIDFTTLPEGGLILPANPLYIAVQTGGYAGVALVRAQVFVTFKSLSDQDYLELLQTMLPSNI